jgi:outer membrane protein W
MKYMNVLAVLAILPVMALAASGFDDEVNAELDRMYDATAQSTGQKATGSPSAVQVNVTNATDQTQVAQQAQKQPVTIIEASPLMESRADKIRKARQDVEVQTEQKIVEKLEMSRIEDERRRSEILFGDKFNQMSGGVSAPAPAVVVPAPTPAPVVLAPVPVQEVAPVEVTPAEPSLSREDVRNEMTAALADMKEKDKKPEDKWFMGALLGVGEYPDASNVKGSYALGVSAGKKYKDRLLVEGSFMYASYDVQQESIGSYYYYSYANYLPRITTMDQYQAALTAKMQLGDAMIRPLIGATMAYTYRSFTDKQFSTYSSNATSDAVDVGAVAGLDLELSDTFSLGLDLRYMINLTSKTSSDFQRSTIYQRTNATPIEKFNYYTLGLVGRSTF